MTILVTGGAGYIGTHTLVELLAAGKEVVVIDNLSNSSVEALARVEEISGKSVLFYQGDILNKAFLQKVFSDHSFEAVIHFAGLKAVGESVAQPLRYYENNVTGTLILCQVMKEYGVRNLVFSSSATVYGDPASLPITEAFPTGATNLMSVQVDGGTYSGGSGRGRCQLEHRPLALFQPGRRPQERPHR